MLESDILHCFACSHRFSLPNDALPLVEPTSKKNEKEGVSQVPLLASFKRDKQEKEANYIRLEGESSQQVERASDMPVVQDEAREIFQQEAPPSVELKVSAEKELSPAYDEDVWGEQSAGNAGVTQKEKSAPDYNDEVWGESPRTTKQKLQDQLLVFYHKQDHWFRLLKRWFRHFKGGRWLMVGVTVLVVVLSLGAVKDKLLNDHRSRGFLFQLNVDIAYKDTDWHVSEESIQMEWVESNQGRDLLLVKGVIENRLKANLPLPLIRFRVYVEDDSERLIQEFVLPIKKVTKNNAISMPLKDLPMDSEKMKPLEKRPFILVVEHLAYDVGRITMRPTLRRPQ